MVKIIGEEMFNGSMVAIVTPLDGDKIDKAALKGLIDFQISNGTNVIVPCGTTGESATLSYEEHLEVIRITVETAAGRVPVLAGTGSNSTSEAIKLTNEAKKLGASGALVITPYYNKPTQEGLYQHFKTLTDEVDIPVVMYNVPGRTGVNMLPETVARLAVIKNIVGIKEASGSLTQISKIIHLCGDGIDLFSGDDFIVLPILAIGGKGVISVAANIIPDKMSEMIRLFNDGNVDKAAVIQRNILKLCDAMFIETNPIPVKTALAMMGKVKEVFRLPMCKMGKSNREELKSILGEYGLCRPRS